MPALAPTARQNLFVDQELVDRYLSRVNRFVDNIHNFEKTLDGLLNRSKPNVSEMEGSVHQTAAAQPEQSVVTADDIDIDALLKGIDLNGMSV